ncbi:MAG: hypothetical protein IKT99_05690, partial [Oscillospiraceae bacterium]|nr:hypothetical protein [Oscillospiraceae bacterium]
SFPGFVHSSTSGAKNPPRSHVGGTPAIHPNPLRDFWKIFTNAHAAFRFCVPSGKSGFPAGENLWVLIPQRTGRRKDIQHVLLK